MFLCPTQHKTGSFGDGKGKLMEKIKVSNISIFKE